MKILSYINGDWGLGIGDWANPQSPIPNPHPKYSTLPYPKISTYVKLNYFKKLNLQNNFLIQ
jgi:hypothetical protein